MNLYIYKYNNYYNRIVKKEETLEGYGDYIHAIINCKDFSPNDGVNTQHLFGSSLNNYDGSGDYIIITDENNNILSRWFVIETKFTRHSQWLITMHRDLIVDYYDDIINAPCFIEKATLSVDSPLIFNSENMTVNQIKTSEILLKDKSDCAWIVGYYDKGSEVMSGTVPTNGSDIPYIQLSTTIEDWEYFKYTTKSSTKEHFAGYPTTANYRIRATWLPEEVKYTYPDNFDTNIFGDGTTVGNAATGAVDDNWGLYFQGYYGSQTEAFVLSMNATALSGVYKQPGTMQSLLSQVPYYLPSNVLSQEDTDELLYTMNNNLIRDTEGKYFKVIVKSSGTQSGTINLTGQLQLDLKNIALQAGFTQTGNKSSYYQLTYKSNKYQIELIEQFNLETTYNITGNKFITTDAPWNIFAIPYSDTLVVKDGEGNIILEQASSDVSINTAMSMQANQASRIYDIQILPYCPIPNLISDKGEITVTNEREYSLISSGGETPKVLGIIFNVPESRFTANLEGYAVQPGQSAIEKKLNNECDKWRLTSPNYSNYFDFSVEKNGGISYFNVDCDYKPFTPYIHINPNFSGLYGEDFNDVRGLVCGGDFSLSQIIDQWEQYQIQNKNFQNIFDRQIQNMELQHKIGRTQDIASTVAGVGQGAAAGALTGSMVMPGIGSAVGAVAGGVASIFGGITDYQMNEQLRTEALDYTKDNFGYQLANIQALPNTISKVSALNNNNKIFPILEYYTCTSVEKEALANKVAWNGMTVMVIGKINDYIGNAWTYENTTSKGYIKGKIIRIEDLEDEFHLLKNISDEIYKGVYF